MSKPLQILQRYWNYPSFRDPQEKIIQAVLDHKDVVAVLPTGSGKSVIYQVAGLTLGGLTLVVSPLVALIEDQVNGLKKRGINAIALSGSLSFYEMERLLDNAQYGDAKFLFISPERLQNDYVQKRLAQMPVQLISIDEAHCISEWGHDFRPSYLKLSVLREILPQAVILSLTATAKKQVIDDIKTYLQIPTALVFRESVFRKNISYKIYHVEEKTTFLAHNLSKDETIIIYVRTRKSTYKYADWLRHNGFSATYFHGGMTYEQKQKTLQDWLSDKKKIIVATNAFGMGIDKPDVRAVIHIDLPASLENYVQESGRAGRDGKDSEAVLLVNPKELDYQEKTYLGYIPDFSFVKEVYNKLFAFYHIGEGDGENTEFPFDILTFCKRYALPVNKTLMALQILDNEELIYYNKYMRNHALVQILMPPDQIRNYIENKYLGYEILQYFVRSYTDILRLDTKIQLKNIAAKLGKSTAEIHRLLLQLDEKKILSYKASGDVFSIIFLQRRDKYNFLTHRKSIEKRLNFKKNQLQQVFVYTKNDKICRSRFLANYFEEENTNDCGMCDICLQQQNKMDNQQIIDKILTLLSGGCQSLFALQNHFDVNIQKYLDFLIEKKQIIFNAKRLYCLK